MYIRLIVDSDGSITRFYATPDAPENWIEIGAFGNYFEFNTVGIGVLNVFKRDNTETEIETV